MSFASKCEMIIRYFIVSLSKLPRFHNVILIQCNCKSQRVWCLVTVWRNSKFFEFSRIVKTELFFDESVAMNAAIEPHLFSFEFTWAHLTLNVQHRLLLTITFFAFHDIQLIFVALESLQCIHSKKETKYKRRKKLVGRTSVKFVRIDYKHTKKMSTQIPIYLPIIIAGWCLMNCYWLLNKINFLLNNQY